MDYKKMVSPAVWDDDKFVALTVSGKLLWLYLLTCRSANNVGVYKITKAKMARDTGIPVDDVETAFRELEDRDLVGYSDETQEVAVYKALGQNVYRGGFLDRAIMKQLHGIINRELLKDCYKRIEPKANTLNVQAKKYLKYFRDPSLIDEDIDPGDAAMTYGRRKTKTPDWWGSEDNTPVSKMSDDEVAKILAEAREEEQKNEKQQ